MKDLCTARGRRKNWRRSAWCAGGLVFSFSPLALAQTNMDRVTMCLPPVVIVKGEAPPCVSLAQRMEEQHVNGVTIAVIHNGALEWARGFGVERAGGKAVSAETLFQAGSISKPVAAMAALRLVEQGKLSLDADVNTELTTWKLPASYAAPGAVVTLRELMTHTAGITVHGFPGYAAGAPVATLVEVLNGEKPANTPAIRVGAVPGKAWSYSGGGYTVMQQMMIDAAKVPFATLLHDTVLAPIGMTHSTYEQPLPAAMQGMAATPYMRDGQAVAGGAHTYPERAAAGLWTTPSDLAKYIIENQNALEGRSNHVLSKAMTEQMMTGGMNHWGLGPQTGGSSANPYFEHGGVNAGFESLFVAYEHGGDGAVVMTNAAGGSELAEEVMRSVAAAYHWPDFQPVVRSVVKVDRAVLARYVGVYEVRPSFHFTYTLEGDQLMTQATGQKSYPAFPESETKFFLKVVDAEIEFFPDATGKVTHLVLYQNGQQIKATKQ